MRIALDARSIFSTQRRGIGKSLMALYQHVAYIRPQWEVVACHRKAGQVRQPIVAQHFRPCFMDMPGDRWHAWENVRLPLAAWSKGANLLHCPSNMCPPWPLVPTLVTVHDLIPLDEPQFYSEKVVWRFERGVRNACQNAWIMCPSQYTRDRLIDRFKAAPDRIQVIPWAPSTSVKMVEPDRLKKVLHRHAIAQPYILHMGADDPRKNTHSMVDAWGMIEKALRQQWELVIVGLNEKSRKELSTAIERLNLDHSVHLLGYVKEEELSCLLSGAEVMAYPSMSEGFGMPVLDAFATNTAVLASNASSIPEVVGEAAILIDPLDTCAITRGLAKLMRDHRLREHLCEMGRARLEQFNWQTAAAKFVAFVEKIVTQHHKFKAASKAA